jgi:pyruvate dehydrogenase E2 component (dihydrolipoamide acetyltransferase)
MTPVAVASAAGFAASAGAAGPVSGTGLGGRVTSADMAALKDSVKTDSGTLKESAAVVPGVLKDSVKTDVPGLKDSLKAQMPEPREQADLMGFTDAALPNIRKVIAKAMLHSISTTCQLTLNASFDATSILAMRAAFKKAVQLPEAAGITLTDMVLFGVARTLLSHRDLNAHFLDDKLRAFDHVHLGLAVDTERGLMVPTLFGADTLSLAQLSAAAKAVAKECQSGRISPDKLRGGTFTVTNLGTFGIESFTPVLNPPQTGILGVNNIQTKVREGKNGLEGYPAMGLSLTFDHRALDGAPAARFLKDLTANLERFEVLLAL